MALQVIGAGFGRTGTESMKLALERLGFAPCHHMHEVIADPAQGTLWRGIANGAAPDWDAAFDGFAAAVDWPSAFFWRELSAYYPDAKVILTLRPADSWYASFSKTIARVLAARRDPGAVGSRIVGEQVFGGRYQDRDHAMAIFEQNTRDVQAAFGPERLLTFEIGDGWEPLCAFLDRPVPAEPFPRSNSTAQFAARQDLPPEQG